jgi:CRISPR/Cas system-associated endonuclease Cas1
MSKYGYGVTESLLQRILEEVVRARAPERLSLISRVREGSLVPDEMEELREILADELVEEGLGTDDEPNERGLLVEAAIDWLGHH